MPKYTDTILTWEHWRELTERDRKKKGGKKEKLFYLWKVMWIFTTTGYLSLQLMYKSSKEVFVFILNASYFSFYLYTGIIVTFYFEHTYLENTHNGHFLFHLNWCLFEFSCFCSLGLILCSQIFNLKWVRGTLANCSYTSLRTTPWSSVHTT